MVLGIPQPLAITLAPNGPSRSKLNHPKLPLSMAELEQSASDAQKTGASLFSLSPGRNGPHTSATKSASQEAAACPEHDAIAQAIKMLQQATDETMALQLSLVGLEMQNLDPYLDLVLETRPDALLITLSDLLPRHGDETDEARALSFLSACDYLGISVQFSLSQPSDIDWIYAYCQYGVLGEQKLALHFALGSDGDQPHTDTHQLRAFLARLDDQNLRNKASWSVSAYGPDETACLAAAIAFGGHVRTGFEYNMHNVEGEVIPDNASRIAQIVEIGQKLGRPPASKMEANMLLFGN